MTLSRTDVLRIGFGAALLTAVALAGANFLGEDGENGGPGPYAVTLAVSLVIAAALFGWAIPRIERPARAGLIVGTLAVLSLPAFWSGLPYVLGPAAVALGLLGRARSETAGSGTAAVVLGAVATLAAIAAVAVEQVL
jgi:hypothetical protein